MTNSLYIVDVFTDTRYAGNPLAVVVNEPSLSEEKMQAIAAEMNFSETAFLTPRAASDGGFEVQIYTPARKIVFAGHPILGTATILREHFHSEHLTSLQLNLSSGPMVVRFEAWAGRETAWFDAPTIHSGQICDRRAIAAALGIEPDDIETSTPVQQMSAGTSALIVPLRSLDALRRARLDLKAFAPLIRLGLPPLVYLFCWETRIPTNTLSARFFFEAHGVREDPATGNGAAFLGAYLLEHKQLRSADSVLQIEQGYEVGRPSLVLLRVGTVLDQRRISIGGCVVATVRGALA